MDLKARAEFSKNYLSRLQLLLSSLDCNSIASFVAKLMDARERGSQIFFIGNGGSASTASHFANDISIGTRSLGKPFRALSLCDNSSVITAIANDYGYDQIFLKQLQAQLLPGDLVIAISASGNSANLLRAIEFAKRTGAYTIGLTGFDGGHLKNLVNLSVHIATEKGLYGPVEDIHMVLDHLVSACIVAELQEEKEDAPQDLLGVRAKSFVDENLVT